MNPRSTALLVLVGLQCVGAPARADIGSPALRLSTALELQTGTTGDDPARGGAVDISPAFISAALRSGPSGTTEDRADILRKVPELPASPHSLARLFNQSHVPVNAAPGAGSFGSEPETLESIDLGQALRLAVEFSRDVRMANTRVESARAQTGQALSLLLPSMTMRLARGRETSSPASELDGLGQPLLRDHHKRIDTTLVLKQPVLDLPGVFETMRRKELERSREYNLRSTEGEAAMAAVQAYVALGTTRLQADLALEFEKQLNDLLDYLRKRADAGAATVSDLDRVRARVLAAYAARVEQEAANASAAVEFARLLNVLPKKLRLPEMRELGAIPSDFDEAIALALKANPDLAGIQAELDAAQTDRTAAISGLLPRLDLEISDFKVVNAGGDTGLQHDQRVMLVANWNIFEGGRSLQLHAEKSARKEETFFRLDDTRRRLVQTLSGQYATLTSVRDRIYSGYSELEALKAALLAVSERMLSGNQSLLDLLDVYERAYQVRVRLVNLHAQEFSAASQIIRNIYGTASNDPGSSASRTPNPGAPN